MPILQMRKLKFRRVSSIAWTLKWYLTLKPGSGQARVKAEAGQVGPVQALLTHWALIPLLAVDPVSCLGAD